MHLVLTLQAWLSGCIECWQCTIVRVLSKPLLSPCKHACRGVVLLALVPQLRASKACSIHCRHGASELQGMQCFQTCAGVLKGGNAMSRCPVMLYTARHPIGGLDWHELT